MKNSTIYFCLISFLFENSSFVFRNLFFSLPHGWLVGFYFFVWAFFLFFLVEIFLTFVFVFFGVRTRKSELLQKYILFDGHHKNMFVWLLDAKFGGI